MINYVCYYGNMPFKEDTSKDYVVYCFECRTEEEKELLQTFCETIIKKEQEKEEQKDEVKS